MGFLNATAHDLSAFRQRGGKIVMHTGWADPILPAPDVIKYYEEVTRRDGRADKTRDFFRLFMAPGMGHCSGGPGPNITRRADVRSRPWVEKRNGAGEDHCLPFAEPAECRTHASAVCVSAGGAMERHGQHRRRGELHLCESQITVEEPRSSDQVSRRRRA